MHCFQFNNDVRINSSGVATDKNTLTIADLGNGTAIQNVVVNASGKLEADRCNIMPTP